MSRQAFGRGVAVLKWYTLLAAVLVLVLLSLLSVHNRPAHTMATWIWDAKRIESQTEEIIAFAEQNGITLIYLHIKPVEVSPEAYRRFNQHAHAAGIKVEALGGDPNWAYAANRGSIGYFVSWVKAFNSQVKEEERFAGIHVDIEPYVLPDWKKQQEQIVRQWLENMEYLVVETKKDSALPVGADLPFWIDELHVPGTEQTVSGWMLERLDSITLMAYRNHAQGANGIVDIVQNIIVEADGLRDRSVIVGVNIRDSGEGENVSFHAHGTAEMKSQLALLQEELGRNPSYAGSAIHDFESWTTILEREEKS
ncbi:hypothetical protein ACAF76_016100 [Brevibacillus sp. TJ4]|uniref:hypothetical protein n=1 Tax=Brevibacillus sp. TJ4 TaxID=3234853 RepID=UPI0037D185D1